MKRWQFLGSLVLLSGALLISSAVRQPLEARGVGAVQRWEYKLLDQVEEIALNRLGDEGWELCGVSGPLPNDPASKTLIFKRPKP